VFCFYAPHGGGLVLIGGDNVTIAHANIRGNNASTAGDDVSSQQVRA
jgi:hypothetical protein